MIIDSSALVALIRNEVDEVRFASAIGEASQRKVSAATLLETSIVLGSPRHSRLDALLKDGGVTVVPFDEAQARAARTAHATYGKGSGSKARLNFGDCFSYALAKVTGEPLLFKGEDFTHTDIEPAFVPEPK